jgi:hypothetical protein
MRMSLIVHYVRLTNPQLCTAGQLLPFHRLCSDSNRITSELKLSRNMSTTPTEILKQGADPATPLLSADGASEGAPETSIHMPAAIRDQCKSEGTMIPEDYVAATPPTANGDLPNPSVGHDPNLPERICPPGYACDEC